MVDITLFAGKCLSAIPHAFQLTTGKEGYIVLLLFSPLALLGRNGPCEASKRARSARLDNKIKIYF